MKFRLLFIWLIFVPSAWSVDGAFPETATATEKATLNNVSDRVYSGYYDALYEAAKMPASIAIPYLFMWTGHGNSSPQHEVADQALGSVQGYASYLQQDMSAATTQGRVPVDDFDILSIIDTPDAAAIIAPYLFDFKTISPQDRDVAGDSNVGEAMLRLGQMKLADSPPKPTPETPNAAYLIAWQKWAIAKGFVPKDWSSRVGAPEWMLRLDAMEKTMREQGARATQKIQPLRSPLPAIAGSSVSTNTPAPIPTPSAVEIKASGHISFILIAGTLVLLVMGGIFALRKRL